MAAGSKSNQRNNMGRPLPSPDPGGTLLHRPVANNKQTAAIAHRGQFTQPPGCVPATGKRASDCRTLWPKGRSAGVARMLLSSVARTRMLVGEQL
jgi:hypothetical protein